MYLPEKLTIHLSSYDNGIGRKARKTSSMPKLVGKWRAQEAALTCVGKSGPYLSGVPAKIQAVTKVNFGCSIVTKTGISIDYSGIVEVEPVVSGRRLTLTGKQWLLALALPV